MLVYFAVPFPNLFFSVALFPEPVDIFVIKNCVKSLVHRLSFNMKMHSELLTIIEFMMMTFRVKHL